MFCDPKSYKTLTKRRANRQPPEDGSWSGNVDDEGARSVGKENTHGSGNNNSNADDGRSGSQTNAGSKPPAQTSKLQSLKTLIDKSKSDGFGIEIWGPMEKQFSELQKQRDEAKTPDVQLKNLDAKIRHKNEMLTSQNDIIEELEDKINVARLAIEESKSKIKDIQKDILELEDKRAQINAPGALDKHGIPKATKELFFKGIPEEFQCNLREDPTFGKQLKAFEDLYTNISNNIKDLYKKSLEERKTQLEAKPPAAQPTATLATTPQVTAPGSTPASSAADGAAISGQQLQQPVLPAGGVEEVPEEEDDGDNMEDDQVKYGEVLQEFFKDSLQGSVEENKKKIKEATSRLAQAQTKGRRVTSKTKKDG